LRSRQLGSYSRTSQHFIEPQGSLPVHKSPPLVPILSQINPVHTTPSYLRSILILSIHLSRNLHKRTYPIQIGNNDIYQTAHKIKYETCHILGCNAEQFCRSSPNFRRNVSPPSSVSKSTRSNKRTRNMLQTTLVSHLMTI
jgi:hypothetical protein